MARTLSMVLLAVATAGVLGTGSLSAGGWAVTTVESLPEAIEVGQPLTIAFTVRQHGRTPAAGLDASVEAVSGSRKVTAKAAESSRKGFYQATLVLPSPGEWSLVVHGWGTLALPPIAAWTDRAPAPLRDAERGRRLFVAKGCATCHNGSIAPTLVPNKYAPEFLARILADPAGSLPSSRTFVSMPDLGLEPKEIASLVAFINSDTRAARR